MEFTTKTMNNDTICAIATPHGIGGIAVIRISGPRAIEAVAQIWQGTDLRKAASHTAHLGNLIDQRLPQRVLDQAVATVFRGPNSFTGEDTVEISVHGSTWIQKQTIDLLTQPGTGIRLAEAGEFTRRAFSNGRIDLPRAEAVADLIAADSQAAHNLAISQMRGAFSSKLSDLRSKLIEIASLLELELDFSEEDVTFASRENLYNLASTLQDELSTLAASFDNGQAIRDGIPVAIIGNTNVGKSSILNALLGDDRAIVSDIHGTTRDIVEDTLPIPPYNFRLMDTAGIRATTDTIESLGIQRSQQAAMRAQILLIVHDATRPISDIAPLIPDNKPQHTIIIANKTDLPQATNIPDGAIPISAKTGLGIDRLRHALISAVDTDLAPYTASLIVTNRRHALALQSTADALARVTAALLPAPVGFAAASAPTDLIAEDLRDALHHLGTITGEITTPDILANIFAHFCIGK